MSEIAPDAARRLIRIAQLLLVVAALALWVASRLTWVQIVANDGLGPQRNVALNGAAWSTGLVPLALLLLAAALAGLAVRGWLLRICALVVAASSAAMGFLAIGFWVLPDVAPRAITLAQVPVTALVQTDRQYAGAVVTLSAGVLALLSAVLMVRIGARTVVSAGKYSRSPRAEESTSAAAGEASERTLWDALDGGVDPTAAGPDLSKRERTDGDTEGR